MHQRCLPEDNWYCWKGIFGQSYEHIDCHPRFSNGPHFEAWTRPEPDIHFWIPI